MQDGGGDGTNADVAAGVGVKTVEATPVEVVEAAMVEAAQAAARVQAEAAAAVRLEAEAAEEAAPRAETEGAEAARAEAEAPEAAEVETEAVEAAIRAETEAAETARVETEAAETGEEAEAVEAARADTEAAEAARVETEAAETREEDEVVEAARAETETAEAARVETEAAETREEDEVVEAARAETETAEAAARVTREAAARDEFPPPLPHAEKVRTLLYNAQSRAARSRRESWSSCGATYFAYRAYIAANLPRLHCALTTASESEFSTRASEHTEEVSAFGTAAAEARTAAHLAGHGHASCPSLESLRGLMDTGGVLPYIFTTSHLLPLSDNAPLVARGARMHADVMAVGCASGAVLLLLCLPFRAPMMLQTLSAHLRRVTGALPQLTFLPWPKHRT
jgi:hypothetical protein